MLESSVVVYVTQTLSPAMLSLKPTQLCLAAQKSANDSLPAAKQMAPTSASHFALYGASSEGLPLQQGATQYVGRTHKGTASRCTNLLPRRAVVKGHALEDSVAESRPSEPSVPAQAGTTPRCAKTT